MLSRLITFSVIRLTGPSAASASGQSVVPTEKTMPPDGAVLIMIAALASS